MPDMTPKIDPIQHLTSPSGHMLVTGPIGPWDTDVLAVVFTVVVSQVTGNTNPVVATAIGWSTQFTGTGQWWATTRAIGPAALQAGGATVAAWATIAYDDGGSEIYPWTLPVEIMP